MPALAEFQAAMAADLLDGGLRTARLLPGDPAGVQAALTIHRNTVLGGLARVLRLTYPTIAWLTGAEFFEQAAFAFACENPPRGACLSDYGGGFAEFLEGYAPAVALPYLGDVARFDLALERCANTTGGDSIRAALSPGATLVLDASLTCLEIACPADELRGAHDSGDESGLAAIDMTPRARAFAVWRAPDGGVSVRPLSPTSGAFLCALLRGDAVETALAEAGVAGEGLATLQAEILNAPFAHIQTQEKCHDPNP